MRKYSIFAVLFLAACSSALSERQSYIEADDIGKFLVEVKRQLNVYEQVRLGDLKTEPREQTCGNGTFLPEVTKVALELTISNVFSRSANAGQEGAKVSPPIFGDFSVSGNRDETDTQVWSASAEVLRISTAVPLSGEPAEKALENAPLAATLTALARAARDAGKSASNVCLVFGSSDNNFVKFAFQVDRVNNQTVKLILVPVPVGVGFGRTNTRTSANTITVYYKVEGSGQATSKNTTWQPGDDR